MVEVPVDPIRENNPTNVRLRGIGFCLFNMPVPQVAPSGLCLDKQLDDAIYLQSQVHILGFNRHLTRNLSQWVISEYILKNHHKSLHGVSFVQILFLRFQENWNELFEGMPNVHGHKLHSFPGVYPP